MGQSNLTFLFDVHMQNIFKHPNTRKNIQHAHHSCLLTVEIQHFLSSSLGHTWSKVQLPGTLHGGLRMSTIDGFSIAGAEKPEKKPQKPPIFARWRVANGGADVDVLLHWHGDLPRLPSNQDE